MAVIFHWFRRDLRIEDNHSLFESSLSGDPVIPLFIFDSNILSELDAADSRVTFIHDTLVHLQIELRLKGSDLLVKYGDPLKVWEEILAEFDVREVHANEDYEPYALERDSSVAGFLNQHGIHFKLWKDQVIFHKDEVVKSDGRPYTVYTPYSRKWKELFSMKYASAFPSENAHFLNFRGPEIPTLESMGFKRSEISVGRPDLSPELLSKYSDQRNTPAIPGTSRIGIHLRFGTISIRSAISLALNYSETWLNELIWRSFFSQLLYHFPHSVQGEFKTNYSRIPWRNDEADLDKWKSGRTGFPLVDAGMRELVATGFMHNRVRMLTASFLCKQLLIDWRLGEAFFAKHLLDYDLSSNVGNWQWASGTGADAAPYFRVFNPITQQEKFDPKFTYIKKWVREFGTSQYPKPMIDLKFARERCLQTFKENLS